MNFLKKNIKVIIGIILGTLLISSISVYATYTYLATDVSYLKNEEEMNVAEALNELYKYHKTYYTDTNFTVKTGWNHYSLGFEPSMMFYYSSAGGAGGVKGDSNLYYVTNEGVYGYNPGHFSTKSDGLDLYYVGNVDALGITFYAIK